MMTRTKRNVVVTIIINQIRTTIKIIINYVTQLINYTENHGIINALQLITRIKLKLKLNQPTLNLNLF